ncbi:hypothetical protein FSP39_000802 [Pinctada imbricata]|uniref:NEDD8-activating enzyme E1 regulatory subunit n=1 Tax=Pinctada imbricata TaxID=66713 RepID=A0AA89BWK7_PINIB|nr:hypothetical protein FSP39_000802 [Pinctada imbricata]
MSGKGKLDKNNKYDRQLRLWGDHGQSALEQARVCLINATATGTEILKNLILPGTGSFTIVDGNKVSGEDVGNNFFLTSDCIGKSRAKVATELLSELNDDVSGNYMEETPESLLTTNPGFFGNFTLVIATNLCERTLLQLDALLWEKNVPLLVCRCYGFVGYMRLVVKEHTGEYTETQSSLKLTESHPDSAHEDLRLDRPFDGLVKYCDSLDLDSMDKKDHSHTPWLVVIYKYLQKWKESHNNEAPKNYKEKKEFKEFIREGIRKNEDGVPEEEENFDEAIKSVNTALVPTRIPSEASSLFEDPCCTNLTAGSKPFWILLRAVKDFTQKEGNGALPLRGTIPDMTADSKRYIELQNVYREQAARDVTVISHGVQELLQQIGKESCISEDDVKTFCKHAAFVRVLRCRRLHEEYNPKTANTQEIGSCVEDEENDLVFYILLRAVDRFYEEYSRYPGWYDDQVEPDVHKLKSILMKLLQEWSIPPTIKDDYVHEMCRYGASELHTVSAFIGGTAAQEAIKVITGQFVPINNTFIYNAMKQTSVTVKL